MKKAVFLDRDGVICKEIDHLHRKEDFTLLGRVGEAIKLLNDNHYLAIVITNQAVVARGMCTEKDVKELNKHMEELLRREGAKIDAVYYCPHHPEMHPDVPEHARKYRVECECRKPKPGMIFQAQKDFQIRDLKKCFMIGDKNGDILSGKNAGCKTILVRTGYGGKGGDNIEKVSPDYIEKDLYCAVNNIILKT